MNFRVFLSDNFKRVLFKLNQLVEMGCTTSAESKEEKKRNDEIDNQIRKDKGAMKSEVKMLLLGTINTYNTRNWRVWEIHHS